MSDYTLRDNAFIGTETTSLFQQAEFFRLHAGERGRFFEWAHHSEVVASVHFTPVDDEGLWRSPSRGTFAGFAFEPKLKIKDLIAFYYAVEATLREQGAKLIEVLPAPMSHDPIAFSNQVYLLRTCGYEMARCDLNQSMEIDARSLLARMSYGNQKRLRKCQREGLIGKQLPLSALSGVYENLVANRSGKGHVLSMTLLQLQSMVETFPTSVVLFGCQDGSNLAATAFCLRLSAAVLYVFYWGDRPGYESYSPVVSVANAIYSYAQEQQMKLIDVGTSTLDCEPNFGLLDFKRGLGFTESLKVSMSKKI